MTNDKYPVNVHKAYHAHVYFDDASKQQAQKLCKDIKQVFTLKVGRFHEKPVGPHPVGSCQISFGAKDFDEFIEWLEDHRNGLTIFVHGQTGNDLKDHTEYAYWLGDGMELDLSLFN